MYVGTDRCCATSRASLRPENHSDLVNLTFKAIETREQMQVHICRPSDCEGDTPSISSDPNGGCHYPTASHSVQPQHGMEIQTQIVTDAANRDISDMAKLLPCCDHQLECSCRPKMPRADCVLFCICASGIVEGLASIPTGVIRGFKDSRANLTT